MRNSIGFAALLVGGALFIGCGNKDNTATVPATQPSMTPPTVTPPAMPDTTKTSSQIDQLKHDGNAMKSDVTKLLPTTKPEMPAMPAMPAMPK